MHKNKYLTIPAGLRDYLPEEAILKRHLENIWERLFSSWGYQEVVTPSFEYYHTLIEGLGNDDPNLVKLIDRSGHILALKPDMTSPIARLVSTRLHNEPLPLRLFYITNVFRYENELQKGRQREFYQAGVELIGAKNYWADAEVIVLAIESLKSGGIKDFEIGLGHVEITRDLVSILCPDKKKQDLVQKALTEKNYVAIESLITTKDSELKNLITRQWRKKEIIEYLQKVAKKESTQKAIDDLARVLDVLDAFGVSDKVFIDLSILRDFNYYTGIVFEGYSTNLGYPLLGGGRYDKLLKKYGFETSATGFAIGIERIMASLPSASESKDTKIDYLLLGENYSLLYSKASELREKGYKVEIDLLNRNIKDAEIYAAKKKIAKVLNVVGD